MPPSFSASSKDDAIFQLGCSPVLAHEVLFADQHDSGSPPFHDEIITAIHSDAPNVLIEAFRGGAKSTRAEEAVSIMAWFQRLQNCLILGDSEELAVERLKAVKHNIENNELAQLLFDVGPGDVWTETAVTLTNGVMLQAKGRGQKLRGKKNIHSRPDFILIDDLEDDESVSTPEGRKKTLSWFTRTVIPLMPPNGRIRMIATPLHPRALAPTLAREKKFWASYRYPIKFINDAGEWQATWPERFPVEWADQKKAQLNAIGEGDTFNQEYMLVAQNPATQVFLPEQIKVVPQVRSWHAVYAMYDPARTTNKKSATTGKAVWSWIGRKLVIWDGFARKLMPDEIVQDIFDCDAEFNPVAIGVEETGLNEWLKQPLRTAQVERGCVIPLRALNAPRGKLDFIRGLQPYFRAGEVEFAADLPDLREQLLGFPTGDIDAPNALAYALRMRLGQPVYDSFRAEHISAEARIAPRSPLWLAVNSDGRCTTAALCQISGGQFTVFADWLADGEPGQVLADMVMEASLFAPERQWTGGKLATPQSQRRTLQLIAPRAHFDAYSSIGLRAAAKKLPANVHKGGDAVEGRAELRRLFERVVHGAPAVRVGVNAHWTLRAMAGGFAKHDDMVRPEETPYRVLMEGVESLAALLRAGSVQDDNAGHFDYTPEGTRFRTARAR